MISYQVPSGVHAETVWPAAVGADTVPLWRGCWPRWIVASTGGALSYLDATGAAATVTLTAGVPVPLSVRSLVAAGSVAFGLTLVW